MMATLMSEAKPLFKGGVAGAAASVVYDKFVSAPIRGALGTFAGGWTDAVGGFIVGLGIKKFSKGKQWGHDAAVGLFSHELALAFETNVPAIGGASSGAAGTQLAPRMTPRSAARYGR